MTHTIRTPVAIVGGGPAGLMLSHLLHLQGIEAVVLEQRSREYVEKRVRAGVLEQGTVDLLHDAGLGARLDREGLRHEGIELRFQGESHRIRFPELTGGRTITIYGQQEVVKDLIEARQKAGGAVHFEVDDVRLLDVENPHLQCTMDGTQTEIRADIVAGCDGFHGICRSAIPADVCQVYEREYPFGWVGVLAGVEPSCAEVTYAWHERGMALHSMRSPELTRLYVQCGRDDTIEQWPDSRIWNELHARLAVPAWRLVEGPVLEKGITGMRSFVVEPMQHGRLYLAGDAAHIVPPTGAKGLNLAMADVRVLADGLVDWFRTGSTTGLDGYSATCLKRVWRAQEFSSWMTMMLHRFPDDNDGFNSRLQLARLRQLTRSRAAAAALAENYVG
jgi:p-hydroxybenzoate 3-monooxygenase